ncbi:MAG: nickel pincer cofactor biosynthesis protein LarC [Polyangiaceae bacterium]
MILAALFDLGVPWDVVDESVAKLGLSGFHLHHGTKSESGIVAATFDVHVDAGQPQRTYGSIRRLLDEAPLDPAVRARAHRTFLRLAEAEARVHRMPLDDVHFHEVGAIDALVDVVGSAAALEYLGAEVWVSPLPMGRGFVKAAHGVLPLPAPAVVSCLQGWPTYDAGIDFEFVTPTGAAIVAAQAAGASRWPDMVPRGTGWGAGTKKIVDRANLLRVVLGDFGHGHGHGHGHGESSTHVVLEANVDDATGELVASVIEVLLGLGANDAWATPIVMKKGRPAVTIHVLGEVHREDVLAHALLRESTSLGLRRTPVRRVERPRRTVEVDTIYGRIPLKVAEGPFGPPQAKPEFDACLAAAKAHGVPVRVVIAAAAARWAVPGG